MTAKDKNVGNETTIDEHDEESDPQRTDKYLRMLHIWAVHLALLTEPNGDVLLDEKGAAVRLLELEKDWPDICEVFGSQGTHMTLKTLRVFLGLVQVEVAQLRKETEYALVECGEKRLTKNNPEGKSK